MTKVMTSLPTSLLIFLATEQMVMDPTQFRERFKAYKEGKQVYQNGLPIYASGKNPYEDSTDFITRYEGWSDTAYQKKGDVPTIGYGTTNPKYVKLGKITRDVGRRAMMEDLALNEPLLQQNIKNYDSLPDSAKIVLRDILYNVGQGNLFRKSPKFMTALNSGNYEEAARQMDWDNNKVGFGGAKKRNAARQKLFLQDLVNHNMIVPKKSELVQQLEEQPTFQPWSNYHQPDYSLNNLAPSSISSWNNAQGPSYTTSGLEARHAYENIIKTMPLLEDDDWGQDFKDGKSPIHIEPANRGKLTRLKKRTGKSESELYNDGNPAHKKMVVFARNARKWKH